jgi:hypothetical protein
MELDADDTFVQTEHQQLLQLLWEDVDATQVRSDETVPQSARRQFIRSMFAAIEAATWIFKQEALEQHAAGVVVFTPSELALLAETSPVLESDGTVRDAQAAIRLPPTHCSRRLRREGRGSARRENTHGTLEAGPKILDVFLG